ncbi:hybrid sensor histidine kinase/response regulator [Melittangium boletus]|uniref:histidine kinase n=1 Tax=Melittangium boletus DSM 14713 TaxID=1294270 RepID=A0A250IDK4_9BACT|nr:ATP-binding protein [Melittangium boletus]ATB29929.1 hybrid sensor histidine kinase/response regulator [Melittangium boletus DSM 14713]
MEHQRNVGFVVSGESTLAPLPPNEAARLEALWGYEVDPAPEVSFDELTRLATRLSGTPIAFIALMEREHLWFKSRQGLELRATARDMSFCAHTVFLGRTLVVPDTAADVRFRFNPFVAGLRFYAGVPLVNPEGFVLGTLCVLDTVPRVLTLEQIHGLEILARQVMHQLEARRTSRAHARLSEALRASQERFDILQHALNEAVWEWNPETGRVSCGPRLAALLGETFGSMGGGGKEWFGRIHPEDQERVERGFRAALDGDARLWTDEYRVQRSNGTWTRVVNRGVFVRDADGRLMRVVGAVEDRTEREELRARLALSDRMASVGTLAAGVAHELNNPLAYVLANLDFAREELRTALEPGSGVEPIAQALEEAREGAERMRLIVRDLKLFSRKDDERLEWVEVHRALDSAAAMAWNEIRHRARLVKDYQPLPAVYANEARLGQVFLNLIVNAAHAIAEGAAERNEIRLSTRVDAAGRVVVEVRDTGGGIPEELRPRILEPFFTTKPLGVGTGLGLPICQDLLTRLGGALEFESEEGVGTVFRVVLAAPERPQREEKGVSASKAPVRRRGHLLVVDDEPMVLAALQRTLNQEHDVTVFTRAEAALAWLEQGLPWDLLLCDVMMPEMTGIELYEVLAKRMPERVGHVVFVTGGAFTERAREFLGRVDPPRLEKPFDFQALRGMLEARLQMD